MRGTARPVGCFQQSANLVIPILWAVFCCFRQTRCITTALDRETSKVQCSFQGLTCIQLFLHAFCATSRKEKTPAQSVGNSLGMQVHRIMYQVVSGITPLIFGSGCAFAMQTRWKRAHQRLLFGRNSKVFEGSRTGSQLDRWPCAKQGIRNLQLPRVICSHLKGW